MCALDAIIEWRTSGLLPFAPPDAARCVVRHAYPWLLERPDDQFVLDPWAVEDDAAHATLVDAVAPCGVTQDFAAYVLDPAANPATNEEGQVVIEIWEPQSPIPTSS